MDIAGGHGAVLTSILQKYPAMKGILFDIDHVIAGAKRDRSAGLRIGVRPHPAISSKLCPPAATPTS